MTDGAGRGILPLMLDVSNLPPPVNETSILSEEVRYWDLREQYDAEIAPLVNDLHQKCQELKIPCVTWLAITNAPEGSIGATQGSSPSDIGQHLAERYQGTIAASEAPVPMLISLRDTVRQYEELKAKSPALADLVLTLSMKSAQQSASKGADDLVASLFGDRP